MSLGERQCVFCVNVRHGEELADRFRAHDIPARSVSGRLSARERQECLENYARGEIRVLCACDLLNEGWDCPDVEVLMMARPTLSKVIYLQQLGRGTRKAPGKECLIVFDFVDNASRYNSPLSLHRLVGQSRYKPGALVLAPSNLLEQEKEALTGGKTPTQVLAGRALDPRLPGDRRLQLAGDRCGDGFDCGSRTGVGRGRGPNPLGSRTRHHPARSHALFGRPHLSLLPT